ncbi:MAG: polyhydroxyalkanoate synthesis regulator DNA-binding domain-containing protein [Candidatus Zixiibacteriota bacterium]
MKVIKRYKNRQLYDSEEGKTVTQTDLAALVKEGVEVKIIDNVTRKDITLLVLGKVMLAETSSWENLRESKELFRKIIILGGDKSMSVLKNTILASIGAFQVTKAKAEKIIDDLIKKGELSKSDRKKAIMEVLEKAEKSSKHLKDKVSKGADKTHTEVTKFIKGLHLTSQSDLKKVEAKLDKLTKAVKKLEKKLADG